MSETDQTIADLLSEDRVFEPPRGFAAGAVVADPEIYRRAAENPEEFWAEQAGHLSWSRLWDRVMDWRPPFVRWVGGGRLNVASNCLDRHVEAGGGDKVAFHWEGEPGDT